MTTKEQLKEIVPGETYPGSVVITEPGGDVVKFLLQSYFVGMYCAIYPPNVTQPIQTGDHNNKTFVRKLKTDINKALKRGAKVEIGYVRPIKELEVTA